MSCGVLFVARAVVLVCGLALGWVAVVARVQTCGTSCAGAGVPLGLCQRGRLGGGGWSGWGWAGYMVAVARGVLGL